MKDKLREFWFEIWPLLLVLAVLCMAVLASGCRQSKDIPVVHDTTFVVKKEYINNIVHDSTYVHDSIMVMVKGDTIWIDRWHDRFHNIYVHDSAYIRDTAYVKEEVSVEVIVEKKKVNWFVSISIPIVAFALYWLLRERKFWQIIEWIKSLFRRK